MKNSNTLKAWAAKTLQERAVLYHRKFPNKKISPMSLCLFYKKHSIRRKRVTRFKSAPPNKQAEYDVWQMESWNALQTAFRAKERVVYVDEVVFTKATIPRLDYALKYSNQTVDEKDFYSKYIAVIAAISADRGVDTILIFDQAVNRFDFIEFL